jgi:hypothetical protein
VKTRENFFADIINRRGGEGAFFSIFFPGPPTEKNIKALRFRDLRTFRFSWLLGLDLAKPCKSNIFNSSFALNCKKLSWFVRLKFFAACGGPG